MEKTSQSVSFWNSDMQVKMVVAASSGAYFTVENLSRFDKKTYTLERFDDGIYLVKFQNGDFFKFI